MATEVLAEPISLVAAHTKRLRCPQCHRFIGSAGDSPVDCSRCGVVYTILPSGLYERSVR